jgi:DnaK suppressor protein
LFVRDEIRRDLETLGDIEILFSDGDVQTLRKQNGHHHENLWKGDLVMGFFESSYRPAEGESYMNPKQLNYFREKIVEMQANISEKFNETMREIREKEFREADLCDRSDASVFKEMKLKACQHYRHLLAQNELALRRIEEGTFGYCRITGDEIGLKRLEALPHAMLSVDAQEMIESGGRFH